MTRIFLLDSPGTGSDDRVAQLRALGYDVQLLPAGTDADAGWTEHGYRDFIEKSHDLICTHDETGKLLSVNLAAEKALGYSREAWIGRNLRDLLIPEVRSLFPAYLAEIAAKGVATGVMRMRAADGQVREWEYHNTLHAAPDGRRWVSGIAHDVTEQLETTRRLRASERRFRALFEQAAVGVAHIQTPTGRILAANLKCTTILGYSPEEMLTLDFDRLLHPDELQASHESMAQLERGDVAEFTAQRRLMRKDGGIVWVELSVSPMWRTGGPPTEHMAVMQDITERKRAETQREALEVQLRHAQKLEAVGTLAGGIAHDFNNLLAVIRGNIDLIRLDMDAQHPATQSIDAISAAANRATELVRQILTFSRKQLSKRLPMPLAPVIEEVTRLLRAGLPANIEIEMRLDSAAPPVLADAIQMHQVVMNLCTNAWHAIEPGMGRITVSLEAAVISSAALGEADVVSGPCARITVRDNGRGMDRETLQRIFEPFFTTKRLGRGSGLGLSVAHGIVKEHGGMIRVESELHEGTSFHVYLPASDPAVIAPLPVPDAEVETEEPAVAPLGCVLYVDDEQAVVSFVTRLIERLGYQAVGCVRGSDAVDAVRAAPKRFDVVLTDYNMPGMLGTDVARTIAAIRPGLPIVLVSGYAEQLDERLTEPIGIRHRLNKPFGLADLGAMLARVIRESGEIAKAG
jgi:PAS domain S-box-containing protein